VSGPKTRILRTKPPWRDGRDYTRCGRHADDCAGLVVKADEAMAAKAKAWNAGRWRNPKQPPPDGLCAICTDSLALYGLDKWAQNPVGILRIDTGSWNQAGRDRLSLELRALASLAAEYPGRFRELLEAEQVMQALTPHH
jgi:hypothetical protein